MKGKCFGCRDAGHSKKDGGHDRKICHWCGKTGHRANVCFDKFMGKPKKQQQGNAMSVEQGSSGDDGKNSPKPEKAAATALMSNKEFIKKLIADQAELKKQIEALKASF